MTFAYEGDRNRDDIVSFAKRLLGPPVGELRTKGDFEEAKTKSEIFFVFTGEQEGPLWDTFYQVVRAFLDLYLWNSKKYFNYKAIVCYFRSSGCIFVFPTGT